MNATEWNAPSARSLARVINETVLVDSQIARLNVELRKTYQRGKLSSINPIDLAAERRNTLQCLKRLRVRKQALIAALKQNASRSWTERGDFTLLMATGVYIPCAHKQSAQLNSM